MRYLLLALAMIACGRGTDVREVRTPTGQNGFAVSCRRAADCFELAGEQCPTGYVVMNQDTRQQGQATYVREGDSAVGRASLVTNGTMLIECRKQVDPRTVGY